MAEFLNFEKNGQTVLINYAHIVAVYYKPNTKENEKQQVHILGQIILKNRFGDSDIFGLATIETLEFDTVKEAQSFVDSYFGDEEKEPTFFEKPYYLFLKIFVFIAIILTLGLMAVSIWNDIKNWSF